MERATGLELTLYDSRPSTHLQAFGRVVGTVRARAGLIEEAETAPPVPGGLEAWLRGLSARSADSAPALLAQIGAAVLSLRLGAWALYFPAGSSITLSSPNSPRS